MKFNYAVSSRRNGLPPLHWQYRKSIALTRKLTLDIMARRKDSQLFPKVQSKASNLIGLVTTSRDVDSVQESIILHLCIKATARVITDKFERYKWSDNSTLSTPIFIPHEMSGRLELTLKKVDLPHQRFHKMTKETNLCSGKPLRKSVVRTSLYNVQQNFIYRTSFKALYIKTMNTFIKYNFWAAHIVRCTNLFY